MRLSWIAVSTVLLAAACGTPLPPSNPSTSEFKSAIALAPLFPASADFVGLAATPGGRRYVLDRTTGIHELTDAGPRLVLANIFVSNRLGIAPTPELTDVVALDEERFAVTAENDGYLWDRDASTFDRYFCYLPVTPPTTTPPPDPSTPPPVVVPPSISQELRAQGIPVKERTESVAYSPESLLLFAQPRTIRTDTDEVMGSELFVFRDSGGQPFQVRPMPSIDFLAGGMLAVDGARVLLGSGNRLYAVDQNTGPTLVKQFDAPIDIDGLARDADGDLLLLDREGRQLLETEMP